MPLGGKRKKHHDKDKYYRLAKEQGLRSRAAFKLSQINRKYDLLSNAKVVIDLCAAPGGWTQIASRLMPKRESIIVAVDILPIRSLGPNVITLIGDITTDACRADIRRNMQGATADVVLHDGAPNVGGNYDKDAYEQNEIALHALKCATQHLKYNGDFVTKLYRSRDYASYVWVAKQFFEEVQAVKPASSRSASAEIFLVCKKYKKPTKIDPRILDPKHIFEHVEGDTTGGGTLSKKFNIFHKQWDQQKRPNRSGYDMESLDFSMRKIVPIREFIEGKTSDTTGVKQGPVEILSHCTGMSFTCKECISAKEGKEYDCNCQFYLKHPSTSAEIKSCVSDLKVLNKGDFKGLLTWRLKLIESIERIKKRKDEEDEDMNSDDSDKEVNNKVRELDSDEEENQIQSEIAEVRRRRLREKKKVTKKERLQASKRRRRAALGMDLNAVDVPEYDQVFSLATITSKGELEAACEVDLDKVTHDEIFGPTEEELAMQAENDKEDDASSQGEKDDLDDKTGYSYRLDKELDSHYDQYLQITKNSKAKTGTKAEKRSKKQQRLKAAEEAAEDTEMFLKGSEGLDHDTQKYAELLGGRTQDDDSDYDESESDDDGFNDEPVSPDEHNKKSKKKQKEKTSSSQQPKEPHPLLHTLEAPRDVKTARWFSNPLFEKMGNMAALASMDTPGGGKENDEDDFSSDEDQEMETESVEDEVEEEEEEEEVKSTKLRGLDAEEVFAAMPKTDKQKRHEKRIKALQRDERRQKRKEKKAGNDIKGGFEVAAADSDEEDKQDEGKLEGLSDAKRKKVLEARELIKAGMGNNTTTTSDTMNYDGFEVVSRAETAKNTGGRPLPIIDERKYDSENEDYDSDDHARTLALGTMMLRQSKAKALVDASYNRFAWNDPENLPDWFQDDENRYYRPQLPIPQGLIDKIKARQLKLAERPIAKVAEARARKSKRAKDKLRAGKKKAESVAQSGEMSEALKLKAISKAMRGQANPGKTYVVARKGGSARSGKGVKVVDKRLKCDKRGMDSKAKKRKKGKQGGLTGSKRRRQHS
eukprot:CAMPEP_0194136772 /NCGR_PEP_ID=MMETSP0152-20130528/6769_1 /TAXON_ID=1049557 /ORGANISM="Thalassiothrix antarctica, Strain L6-D1" /LENGTH=1043 /DNA_ID=CAMNT_0038833567 /DNA_START=175 /DNA_END=3306 /DNA_ORIENTATION=-